MSREAQGGPPPLRLADFTSLSEGLDYAARSEAGLRFYGSRGELEYEMSYATLQAVAMRRARQFNAFGLERSSRVGLVAATGPEFLTAFYGCQYAGLVPCPLPYTVYSASLDSYKLRIAAFLRTAGASVAISTAELLPHVWQACNEAKIELILSYADLAEIGEQGQLAPLSSQEEAYLQFSSGSTAEPKGVRISQKAILANAQGILRQGIELTPHDRSFSWLPFYHDMGLVGFSIAPMLGQCSVDYLSTSAFVRRPTLWLQLMSRARTTITYAPTFGYELAARRLASDGAEVDLSRLRIAGVGGDMIRPQVLKSFAAALSSRGFHESSFLPSYGMAEATLAVSFGSVGEGVTIDAVDRSILEAENKAVPSTAIDAKSLAFCGRALECHQVVVVDAADTPLAERMIGRVLIGGPSLMTGYVEDDRNTKSPFNPDGLFDSGDLGYKVGTSLVVTGRAKDLILHNGRNIWPQDIEWTVAQLLSGLGRVAAFAVGGAEEEELLIVLVESSHGNSNERVHSRRQIEVAIAATQGLTPRVEFISPGSLPYTSSGKIARAAAKARYLKGLMDILV